MIIAVTDRKISAASDFLEQIEAVANSSPDMIILREKDLSDAEYRYLTVECLRICDAHDVRFCVNTFIKTARSIGNGRVQISFGSLRTNAEMLNGFEEIWVSVHSAEEAKEAAELGATHLIYGNVFETSCKPGAKGKGLKELKKICGSTDLPVFAIGGMDERNAHSAIDAGCKGICVRSALMTATNPSEVMAGLRKEI